MGADLVPPWCEDSIGSADDFCASVFMDRLFVGPKREGEIYNVLHMDADLYVPGEPAIYVRWEEAPTYRDFCDFPEYHSTVASGTATVASEDPFTMTFAVEFQDDEDQFRLVTTTLTFTGYNEECRADN
ncbi:MAG TPA: hypothetical protein P5147_01625 [Myxococcota bacterium]|nr:hypothetical protein [Myxococcota bacterium]